MKKSDKAVCVISGILLGLIVLYLAGKAALAEEGLEYRFRVDAAGKCLYLLVLPLWVEGIAVWKLWQRFRENPVGRWLVKVFGFMAVTAGLAWSLIGTIAVAASVKEDYSLGGGLLVVVEGGYPESTSYAIYESTGLLFRRRTSLTPEVTAEYLSRKYHGEFYPVDEGSETLYTEAERGIAGIRVEFKWGELYDNYPQALADHCLEEGYRELGLGRDMSLVETGDGGEHFCLVMDGDANDVKEVMAYGADIYRLIQYALKRAPLLKEYDVFLCLAATDFEGRWARFTFGRTKPWERISWGQYSDSDEETRTAYLVKLNMDAMGIRAWHGELVKGYIQEIAVSDAEEINLPDGAPGGQHTREPQDIPPASTPQPSMREMMEGEYPGQCRAAEAIWEAELKEAGFGFDVSADAKGHLVIGLGRLPADNLQSDTQESDYYLNYDRESQNSACYLFVLVEVPDGNSRNDAYLREFYACEKDTLKVVAGQKTSWDQTGCAEYREITGE